MRQDTIQLSHSEDPSETADSRSCSDLSSRVDARSVACVSAHALSLPVSGFRASANPFLFPLELLDAWTDDVASAFPAESCSSSSQFVNVASHLKSDFSEASPRWWLVHTKPRQEKKLASQLSGKDIPHYLPVTNCKAVTRGRPRFARLPLFPGYMFVFADPDQRRSALITNRIVATHTVEDQVGLGRQLWNLADLIDKGVPLRVEDRLRPGQLVRIKSGLLKDKTGTIIKRGGKSRLFVFVNELLGGVSLDIEQHLLESY